MVVGGRGNIICTYDCVVHIYTAVLAALRACIHAWHFKFIHLHMHTGACVHDMYVCSL